MVVWDMRIVSMLLSIPEITVLGEILVVQIINLLICSGVAENWRTKVNYQNTFFQKENAYLYIVYL